MPQQTFATNAQQMSNFLFHVGQSTNVLLIPIHGRQMHRLLLTVKPNVAGFCDWCGKCYDQIALELLGERFIETVYYAESVRDRGVKSRAFIDGFQAALFSLKGGRLSQPHICAGAVGQP